MRNRSLAVAVVLALFTSGCHRSPPAELISSSAGGSVQLGLEATLTVPAGSLPRDTSIAIERLAAVPDGERGGFAHFGQAYRLTPAGTSFDLQKPATLSLALDMRALADKGLEPTSVVLHYLDEEQGRYVAVATRVDPEAGRLTATLEHFTIYVPLAITEAAGDQAPLVALQATVPNPPRQGAPVLVRATVRDFDNGGSIAGVWALVHGSGGTITLPMQRDPLAASLDTFTAVVPASLIGPTFLVDVQATDNLGHSTTAAGSALALAHSYAGNLAIAPAAQTLTAGSTRTFAVTAQDETGASFALAPETAIATVFGFGTVTGVTAAGVNVRGENVGQGVLRVGIGGPSGPQATSVVTVLNGDLARIDILDANGHAITGTEVVKEGQIIQHDALGRDAFGNAILVDPTWAAQNVPVYQGLGWVYTLDYTSSTQLTATVGNVTGSQWIDVVPRVWDTVAQYPATDPKPAVAYGAGTACSAWYFYSAGTLPLVCRSAAGTQTSAAPSMGNPFSGSPVSLAMLASTPYLAWSETTQGGYFARVFVQHLANGAWVQDGSPLVDPNLLQYQQSIAVIGSTIYAAWVEGSSKLYVAHLGKEGTWILDGGDLGGSSSTYSASPGRAAIVAGPGNVPYVAFRDAAKNRIFVKHWSGTAWVDDITGGIAGAFTDPVITASPFAVYLAFLTAAGSAGELRVWTNDYGGWYSKLAPGTPATGVIGIGHDGVVPYVSWTNSLSTGTSSVLVGHFDFLGYNFVQNLSPFFASGTLSGSFTVGAQTPFLALSGLGGQTNSLLAFE